MSGTPRNDEWQEFEDTLCTCRLFSLHGSYMRAVMQWLDRVVRNPDRKFPKILMLDSGAFTAWNAGQEVHLDEVFDAYSRFEDASAGLFDEIFMINLDKIPGERGRTASDEEKLEAIRISDENYARLVDRFGERILPVYHQDESDDRLFEVAEMTDYICVSPRNDLPEGRRKKWAQEKHSILEQAYGRGVKRTHGLATTGNEMIREVPWYSIDSAAWVLHGGYGMIDVFFEGPSVFETRYRNYFISNEGGKQRYDGHIDTVRPAIRAQLDAAIERYGFTQEQVRGSGRIRGLVCMGELDRYAQWAYAHQEERMQSSDPLIKIHAQQSLLGDS